MKQYLFYQHNVQQFFIRHRERFDGVAVPLSIATSFPDGTHGFLQALFAKDQAKQFFIDPRAALFQKGWNRKNVRPPHEKMAQVLGPPFTTKGLASAVEVSDLTPEVLIATTTAAMAFQKAFRIREQDKKKIAKYKALLGVDEIVPIGNPQLLIPPYFEYALAGDDWYEASMRCIEIAAENEELSLVRPVLHFASTQPAVWDVAPAIARLKAAGITSIFIYPNNYREHEEPFDSLVSYGLAVRQFAEAGIEPYALHGGFFAMMLSAVGLAGFGNGVGYGEWRDSTYHKGGSAGTRLYVPKLHRFLDPAKLQPLIVAAPEYFAGDSDLLAACVASNRPLDAISQEEALEDFMDSRAREIALVTEGGLGAVRAELQSTVAELAKIGPLEAEFGVSLNAWDSAAGNLSGG